MGVKRAEVEVSEDMVVVYYCKLGSMRRATML